MKMLLLFTHIYVILNCMLFLPIRMALEVLEYSAHLIWTTFIMAFWSFTDIMNLMYGKKSV